MKKWFKYNFYALIIGWMLFSFLVLYSQYASSTFNVIVFFLAFILCFISSISFSLLNRNDDFFKNQEEIQNLREKLEKELFMTSIIKNTLSEKLNQEALDELKNSLNHESDNV
jgi:hypothetical protein